MPSQPISQIYWHAFVVKARWEVLVGRSRSGQLGQKIREHIEKINKGKMAGGMAQVVEHLPVSAKL
jgi:hypothetical protein